MLIIEQIIAYTLDIDLFKISILQDNGGFKYYFSSTVIPLVLTILFMLCIRLFMIDEVDYFWQNVWTYTDLLLQQDIS